MQRDAFYQQLIAGGVVIESPETTFIERGVRIASGVVIEPNNVLKGNCVIGRDVVLRAGNYIEDSNIGKRSEVIMSRMIGTSVGADVSVGPFSHLRQGAVINDGCRIGNFVEIKNSTIGAHTKIAHLSYIGDAEVGRGVNIGCGVVTVNYDGKHKHKTVIEDHAFIGSNANLIAPVKIGQGAVVGAGSTITEDVPAMALAIARARQTNKTGYRKVEMKK